MKPDLSHIALVACKVRLSGCYYIAMARLLFGAMLTVAEADLMMICAINKVVPCRLL